MPFTTKKTTLNISNPQNKLPEERDKLGYIDVIGDSFHIDNPVVGFFKQKDRRKEDANFNTVQRLQDENVPVDLWESFVYVDDENEYQKTKESVQRDLQARENIANAGVSGILASITAASASPSIFIGGSSIISALNAGTKAFKAGLITAGTVGATIYGEEKLLQSTQAGRTDEEVALNVMAGALLSGLVSAGGVKLSNSKMKQLASDMKEKIRLEENIGKLPTSTSDWNSFSENLSAAISKQAAFEQKGLGGLTKEQLGIKKASNAFNQKLRDGWLNINKQFNPAARMISSESKRARQFYLEVADASLEPQLTKEGFPLQESLEGALKRRAQDFAQTVDQFGQIYKSYKLGKPEKKLSIDNFKKEVGRSFFRNVDHPIKEVNQARQLYEKFYEGLAQELIDLKLLPKEITSAREGARYLNRSWITGKIEQDIPAFKNRIKPWMRGQLMKIRNRLEGVAKETTTNAKILEDVKPTAEALDAQNQLKKYFQVYEPEDIRYNNKDYPSLETYLNQSVDDIVNNLLKNNDIGGFNPPKAGKSGPLKKRAFDIPDRLIEDYLDTDIIFLADRYLRQVAPAIEIKKRFGDTGLKDILKEVNQEYDELINNSAPKKGKKLNRERREVLRDMETTWQLLEGTYKGFGGDSDSFLRRASNALMNHNYMTSLGGVVQSSIPDPAMGILRRGFSNFFGKSLKPFIKDVMSTGGKMTRAQAKALGQSLEVVSSSRSQSIFQIMDPLSTASTPLERFIAAAGHKFSNISGINYWNDLWQQVNQYGITFRITDNIETLRKSGKIPAKEEQWLNFVGLGKKDLVAIGKEIETHGEEINGILNHNINKWSDSRLVKKFKAAVTKEIDRTVVTKGVTDIPRFGNTLLGRVMFQWQNFTFAFNNKVILNGMAETDGRMLAGLGTLVLMGMLTEYVKNKANGREMPDNPALWIDAGLDRSGILGVISYGNSYADLVGLNYKQLLGEESKSKPGGNYLETLLGPSGRTFKQGTLLAQSILDPDKEGLTKNDIRRGRSQVWGQNLFWAKDTFFDPLEKKIAEDLPESR